MANLDNLTFDVIDYILKCDCISFVDICRLACVSKMFNSIARSNMLWKKKYKQMWPDLAVLYHVPDTDWRNQFKKQYSLGKSVIEKLFELSGKFYHTENISNDAFLYFRDIVQQEKFGFEIISYELESILNDSDSHLNLTRKYYAEKALKYVHHEQLKLLWQELLSQPPSEISLVEGACLVSQWYSPRNSKCTVNVSLQITDIAARVLELVKRNSPKHPVVEHGLTDEILTESLWTPPQCKHILNCIETVFFKELKFCVTRTIDVDTLWHTFIDQVLNEKKGHAIIVGIIYATVAGKLGVACLPVNFPSYFFLKWLEHPELTDEKEAYTLIDVFKNGKSDYKLTDLLRFKAVDESFLVQMTVVDVFHPIEIFDGIVSLSTELVTGLNHVVGEDAFTLCDSLVLQCLLKPDDLEHKLLLARFYKHLHINTAEAISLLKEIADRDVMSHFIVKNVYISTKHGLENVKIVYPPVQPNIREHNSSTCHVQFAVGMIMRHKKYNYRCVIYGWDPLCKAGINWIRRMGVNNLEHKAEQPFYHVLVSDGTNRYAAEENLILDERKEPIDHVQIGRYFDEFHDNYYLPNNHTALEYPNERMFFNM